MTAGKIVSHYEIVEKLGEGGMGVVFKARDLSLHRLVALKFLPSEITNTAGRVARFEAEARAISALNHPNIATIHSMDEDAGRRFLVLEYLEGGTLRDRIRNYRLLEQPFPLHEALNAAIQLAEGLSHAHQRGIVHRDIKPENVMFTGAGMLRLADFGLAKSTSCSEITRDGTTVGTAAYMAPEQALRNETTPRGDLFSIGVLIYELIAGRRPFIGAGELATLQSILNDDPPSLHLLRPDVPPALERILERLLRKDPAERYQSAQELLRDLRAVSDSVENQSTTELNYSGATRSLTRPIALQKPGTSRMRRWALAASAGVLLCGGAYGLWHFPGRASGPAETELAVLPFSTATNSREDVAFGSGLSGIVAGRLASLGANVVPDNDLRRNRVTTPAEARRVFGTPMVLTGHVERPGEGVRVVLNIVDTSSGKVLRSATVDSHHSGPVQDQVLREAASLAGIAPDRAALNRLRAQDTKATNAYDHYVLGNGYLQRWDQAGNLGFAIASFNNAIRADPAYALAYAALGQAYWRQYNVGRDQQDMEHARDAALQALSRNESLDAPHVTLGAIAVAAGQIDEGIRQLRMALDRNPVNAEACRELANAFVASGKLADAEATYRRAIQYRPAFWLGYNDLGVFFNDHGRYGEAEEALLKAASLTPDNYVVFRNLGGVQMALGKWTEAEHSFRKAMELRPRGSVFSNLGSLYIFSGRYAEAVPVLRQAVAMSGSERNSYLIWGNLGDAYRWATGHDAEAAAAYAKAIDLASAQLGVNPNDATLLSQIAVYCAKVGKRREAADRMAQALQSAPKDSSVLFRSAIVHELGGARRQSLAALHAAIAAGYSENFVQREPELTALRSDPAYKRSRAKTE